MLLNNLGMHTSRCSKSNSKVRNFFWAGKDRRARTKVAWDVVCLKQKEGGLNIINSKHALATLLYKWIFYACGPSDLNFKILLKHKLASFQPYA
jgi:hypothetical protein